MSDETVLAFAIGLCPMWVVSDSGRGGYRVVCGRHGTIGNRHTIGEAEGTGHIHGRKWERIDKVRNR